MKNKEIILKHLGVNTPDWVIEKVESIISEVLNEPKEVEPETIKPEDMKAGEWYVIEVGYENLYLSKFLAVKNKQIVVSKTILIRNLKRFNEGVLCSINLVKSIRKATKEEVLKYFPDEQFN